MTRAQPGRPFQRPWRHDPDVLRRIEVVGQLWDMPRMQQLQATNAWLERHQQESISLATLDRDRRRVLELLRERTQASSGVQGRLEQLERLHAEMWRRLRQIPDPYGNPAAAIAAVITRCVEDSAKLDGSWGAGGVEVNVQIDATSFGKSPREQFEAGDITETEYLTSLRVLHAHTSSGTVQDQVIEGESTPIDAENAGNAHFGSENGSPPAISEPRGSGERPERAITLPDASSGPAIVRGGPQFPPRRAQRDELPLPPIVDGDPADWDQ